MAAVLEDHVRAFLSEPHAAVIATVSPRGRPQATPIWFMVEGDHILVNTSRGRVKLENLKAHPFLTLTIVDPKNMYRYVQIQGKVVRFDAEHGARDIDRLSMRYTGESYAYRAGGGPKDRVSLYIKPLRVSGLRRG